MINTQLNIHMIPRDIDNAHRLGPYKEGGTRHVIVKFVNRHVKNRVLAYRKRLRGTHISVYEDLTRLNNEVFASARLNMAEDVDQAWSRDGKLFVKWKAGANVERITYKDYQWWLDLPWPPRKPTRTTAGTGAGTATPAGAPVAEPEPAVENASTEP